MSQYTREEILRMIENKGGPQGLNLRKADLSEIDLSNQAIQEELKKRQRYRPGDIPIWHSPQTKGINLVEASLEAANLQEVSLVGANLQEARLQWANLQEARLMGAILQEARLQWANLKKAKLSRANLQEASLVGANLQEASLGGANLKKANLGRAKLERVDLSDVANISSVFWHNAILDRTRLKWDGLIQIGEEQDKKWNEAKEAYLILKDNFDNLGQHDYARECYIKEREMERKASSPPWRALQGHQEEFEKIQQGNSWLNRIKRLRLYLKYITRQDVWSWSLLTIFKFTSLYGQSPLRVLGSGIAWILFFSFFYPIVGVFSLFSSSSISWAESIIYSIASFATLELSGYQAVNFGAQLLTSLEALIGIIWLAYFVYAFTNMMRSS